MLELARSLCQFSHMTSVMVNFVAFDEERDACLLVLVEEAWTGSIEDHLRSLQERLYGCLDAALDGNLAEQLPKSRGKPIILQIDCYDLPREEINDFVERFAAGVTKMPDYSTDSSRYVSSFQFEVNHDRLDD